MYNELLNKFGFIEAQVGTNEDGEPVIVSIDKESATVTTIQSNGWHMTHTYYPDGTCCETFSK